MEAVFKALTQLTDIHPLFKDQIWVVGNQDNVLEFQTTKKRTVDTTITPAKVRLINRMLRGTGYYCSLLTANKAQLIQH